MVDLKAKPFYLTDEQVAWVEKTMGEMSLDEKIGQLFILLKAEPGVNEEKIQKTLEQFHQGGLRWQGGDKKTVYEQNRAYQKYAKIPLVIAGNCDDGGSGVLPEGTFVATAAEAGAGEGTETAYHIGYVAGKEAASIGVNWMFNPVADVYKNWRNTIVNTRSFGSDTDKVIENVRAYIKGIKDAAPNMACTCKHFPGDGMDELDPHLSLAHNELSVEEWEASYGRVYRTMIDEGLESIMIGQITLPDMQRKLRPGIQDADIMPATLAPELLQDLLREDMKFNGVIVSDASHMIGMAGVMERKKAVPACIAAGCDIFLFANDVAEDIQYMKDGIADGILTEERIDEAVCRILGMKAHLGLMDGYKFPEEDGLNVVGCEKHRAFTKEAADRCVTLVKDTAHLLPIDPRKKKRALLVFSQNIPNSKGYGGNPTRAVVTEELERAGFEVEQCPNFYDLEVENGVDFMNHIHMMQIGPREEYKKKYDVIFLFIHAAGYAQQNEVRLNWSCSHSMEMPWYTEEVPTVAVSLNYTTHLIDIARIHTYINAYGTNRENIRAAVEKICGMSGFHGTADETVFCGRWDTRL